MKTHYILYQIINNLNGKIYVGVHKTNDLNDGYMGSGKVIRRAIEKHGLENFTKVILEQFETAEEMFAREKEVVNESFLAREDTYNLRRGGTGGFDYINDGSPEHKERTRKSAMATNRKKQENGTYISPFSNPQIQSIMNDRSRSIESITKRKNTFAAIGHSKGDKNSQFGTKWINNGVVNKKIHKSEYIPEGWVCGRIRGQAKVPANSCKVRD